ncbi:hypothetical protein [Hymenobacter yonginensis]|uniref:Uncharacterized protein n=1 Tax=Hymenobacter yonginensis TaxID=748197 RepID=A0ABY7PST8_9BACT|nr:hypothetical protein [Hymenobacter yonginensis]WBO85988.1 hypothetical protein O9Z63_06975 [Hymenobacter yonginensis]
MAVVFGTEYTTEYVGKVLGHEVTEAELGRKFSIKGEKITDEALGKNKAALKHLIESRSGPLVPIDKT